MMMSHNSSAGSEGLLHDDDVSVASQDDVYSPLSNYSTYSHELRYIFDPIQDTDIDADYSIIPPRNKSGSQSHATLSQHSTPISGSRLSHASTHSASHLSQHSTPQLEYHHTRSTSHLSQLPSQQPSARTPPQTYRRTYSTSSCTSEHSLRDNGYPTNHSSYPYYPSMSHSRRKTWSPAALKSSINAGIPNLRACHSNDTLDPDKHLTNIYEDLDRAPPNIAPESGVFHPPQNAGRNIIRPIAFKPVNGAAKTISPPRASHRRMSNQDDGYGSHDYSHMTNSMIGGNGINSSHSSHQDGSDKSASFCSDFSRPVDRPESLPSLNMSRISNNMEVFPVQTPSPSDSGVGELEVLLREKDAEINTLRDVMDRNERAIFQVYEEKKSTWLRDVHEIREDYEKKFKIQQRKSYKTEQVLSLQVYKLQQEKKTLKEEYDKVYCEKDIAQKQCVSYEAEIKDLRLKLGSYQNGKQLPPQLDEMTQLRQQVRDLNEEVCLKNREVLTLRTQLHNNDAEMDKKNKEISEKFKEILSKTEELKSLKNELGKLSAEEPEFCDRAVQCDCPHDAGVSTPELLKPSLVSGKDKTIVSLQEELFKQNKQLQDRQLVFDKDREQWLDEKNKVIRYQKQLQLNYVQMFRKNKMLEAEVEQLTLELETRDLKLMAMNGEESVC